jgi:hypothetical protein
MRAGVSCVQFLITNQSSRYITLRLCQIKHKCSNSWKSIKIWNETYLTDFQQFSFIALTYDSHLPSPNHLAPQTLKQDNQTQRDRAAKSCTQRSTRSHGGGGSNWPAATPKVKTTRTKHRRPKGSEDPFPTSWDNNDTIAKLLLLLVGVCVCLCVYGMCMVCVYCVCVRRWAEKKYVSTSKFAFGPKNWLFDKQSERKKLRFHTRFVVPIQRFPETPPNPSRLPGSQSYHPFPP